MHLGPPSLASSSPSCHTEELLSVIPALQKRYRMFQIHLPDQLLLLQCPLCIFVFRINIRIIIKHSNPEIPGKIFQYIAAAGSAAAVKKQSGHTLSFPALPEFCPVPSDNLFSADSFFTSPAFSSLTYRLFHAACFFPEQYSIFHDIYTAASLCIYLSIRNNRHFPFQVSQKIHTFYTFFIYTGFR